MENRNVVLILFSLSILLQCSQQIEPNECYQFTWLKDANATEVRCSQFPDDRPCNAPFIITTPTDMPPNITDLEQKCDNQVCSVYSCSPDSTCLKWVIYDIRNLPLYMSLYCGKMVDITNIEDTSKSVDDITHGCYTMRNSTETIEACACMGTGCNAMGLAGGAASGVLVNTVTLFTSSLLLLLVYNN